MRRTSARKIALRSTQLTTAFFLALGHPGVAAAQDMQTAAVAGDMTLEEIIVSARKMDESLISVPLSITAFTGEDVEARGIRDAFSDVAAYTPGFTFQNQSVNRNDRGFKTFTIRGMAPGSGTSTRQAAAIFLDGTYVAGGNISGLTDIERVEVVKGPQSAYFGRSTFAGAINYVTRTPANEWQGRISGEFATFATTDFSASVEGPVIKDKLAVRVGGRLYHTGGAYSNVQEPGNKLGERDTKSISTSLYATPTDNLTVKVYATYWQDLDGPPANAAFNPNHYNCNAGAAPTTTFNYICGKIEGPPTDTRTYNTSVGSTALDFMTGKQGTAKTILGPDFFSDFGLKRRAAEAKISFDYVLPADYTLSGNAAYDRNRWRFITDTTFRDTRSMPNPNFGTIPNVLPYFSRSAAGDADDTDYSGELRFSSPRDSALTWMLGTNYFDQYSEQGTTVFGTAGFVLATPTNIFKVRTIGLFGSAGYDFDNGISVSLEGRYQFDRIFQQTLSGTNPSAQATFKVFTPRVILEYEARPGMTTYVSFARGSRPGEFNTGFFSLTPAQQAQATALGQVGLAVPEEYVDMGEVGLKGVFFEQRLRVLAAAYYGYWSDRHVPNSISLLAPNGTLIRNVAIQAPGGEVRLSGLEVEGTFRALPELTLEGTFNIANTNIRKTLCSDCFSTTGNRSPVGTRMPGYPKYKGTFSAEYNRPIFDDINGFVRADYLYTGRIYDTEANVSWIGPSSKVNLRMGVSRGGTRVEIYGTNVFDDRTPSAFSRNTDTLTGRNGIVVSLPDKATFGVRVNTTF